MPILGGLVGIDPDEPLFGGLPSSPNVPFPFPVAIGGHPYEIDLKFYSRHTIPPLRPQMFSGTESGEATISAEGVWRRNQESWHMGAGARIFDAAQDSDRRRFWTSKGVDPWTPFQLSLLNATRNIRAVAGAVQKLVSAPSSHLYHSNTDAVSFTADPTGAAPTWTAMTGGGAGLNDLMTDGTYVYGAFGTTGEIYRALLGTAAWTATWATLAAVDHLAYEGGRLIASAGPRVAEVNGAGTVGGAGQLDFTHRQAGWKWTAMQGGPSGIYLAGEKGDVSEIYVVTANNTNGQLVTPIYAGGLPFGERVRSLAVFGDVMVIVTTKGLRLASIQSGSPPSLQIGPLITAPGDVTAVHIFDRFAWFAWTNYDTGSTGLGRADLSHFVEPLVPAYASDLMASAQGAVQDIVTWGNYRYFCVSGVGLFAEYATKVSTGEMRTGLIRYGNFERKIPVLLDIRHQALVGTISGDLVDEQNSIYTVSADTIVGSLGPVSPWVIQGVSGDAFGIRITMTSDGATGSPVLTRVVLKSIIVPQTVDEIVIPVILKSRVKASLGEGQDLYFNAFAEYQYLHGLVASANVITYQEGNQTEQVRLTGVTIQEPDEWLDERTWLDGVLLVTAHTIIPTS